MSATKQTRLEIDTRFSFEQNPQPLLSPRSPILAAKPEHRPVNRPRNESRKLLAHLLQQLQNRPLPRTFDASLSASKRNAVQRKRRKDTFHSELTDDDDFEDSTVFSTDHTYDLMVQVKEVIIVSTLQEWRIFHEDSGDRDLEQRDSSRKSSTPFRLSRNNLEPEGRRSRSPSPNPFTRVRAPQLLEQCISVIASVISEDCRFKMATPRPSRPPYALQALTLDVAGFLLHNHRHDPKVISQIGFAVIPAFTSFQPELHVRLLAFFEQSVIRPVLENLQEIQQDNAELSMTGLNTATYKRNSEAPMISIQVDGVHEDENSGAKLDWQPWLQAVDAVSIPSTNAPSQALAVHQLSSLVPPLLASILQSIDLSPRPKARIEVLHRFYQLVNTIVSLKRDTYLDILSIVAYHTANARLAAISLLSTFWPKSLGHPVISKSLQISSYHNSMKMITSPNWPKDLPHEHEFVPFRFVTNSHSSAPAGSSPYECRSCTNLIDGFGLLCPFCTCAVHFDCYDYPEGNKLIEYTLSDRDTQKVAMKRYSAIVPPRRDDFQPEILTTRSQHDFQPVTMFTLSLCFVCREPVWGTISQGLQCSSCDQFIHRKCRSSNSSACDNSLPDSSHFTVDWENFRSSCIGFYQDILHSKEELGQCTYEEVSVIYSTLWIQLQILINGIYLGSIVIADGKKARHRQGHLVNEFELHSVIQWCEGYLFGTTPLPISEATQNYLQENDLEPSGHFLMFDWSFLIYILSIAKSQYDTDKSANSSTSGLLNVVADPFFVPNGSADTSPSAPFEAVTLAHMRNALGYEFNILADAPARLLLAYLHQFGFFERADRKVDLLDTSGHENQDILCIFPIPWGLDESVDVETLVCAVEACLVDLHLSVNEAGFLLLVRRLWPNGMTSEYASRRLARNVITWILAEDDNLAIILRDYLAKQQTLPGVRSATDDKIPWPSTQKNRPAPTSSVNNGGDYVATRRLLLGYAVRWLSALYQQDTAAYAYIVYQFCTEIAKNVPDLQAPASDEATEKDGLARAASRCLRYITKLSQASVTFKFEEIFTLWLDGAASLGLCQHGIPALLRLFSTTENTSHRFSMIEDGEMTNNLGSSVFDHWRLTVFVATESKEGLSRAIRWLCLYAHSGVNIPVEVFVRLSTLGAKFQLSLQESSQLITAALATLWINPLGRQNMQDIFAGMFERHTSMIAAALQTNSLDVGVLTLIRQSLASLLLVFGADRSVLKSLKLILDEDIKMLPLRRKTLARSSTLPPDPIAVDPKIMGSLEVILNTNVDTVSCQIAKFLHMFVADSPFLEAYEIDNFILRNGRILSLCAWKFYDIQEPEISGIRANFLLRVLVVDYQPFQTILHDNCHESLPFEKRLLSITRLFRIILDVTSPAFNIEDRQWRASVADIFYQYFGAGWLDQNEHIRFAVETWSKTLLPAHFQAITLCWNETLVKSPIADRLKLVAFLMHLRPHFSSWKILDWHVIIETLLEDDYDEQNAGNEDGPAAAHLSLYGLASPTSVISSGADLATGSKLRVSILALSLSMIADGIDIDVFSLLKIKFYLAQILGFKDVSLVPSHGGFHVDFEGRIRRVSEASYPCIHVLTNVLDAARPFDLPTSAMGREGPRSHVLVGSVFVDLSLSIFSTTDNLMELPPLTLKTMLESLVIIIYKHDFDTVALKPLLPDLRASALKTLSILPKEISYELRLLALSVCQAFIQRIPSHLLGTFVYESVIAVAKLVASPNQDSLQIQAKGFLDITLAKYAMSGLLNTLCKHHLDEDFFVVLRQVTEDNTKTTSPTSQSLRELLLRDALVRAVDNDKLVFDLVTKNLNTYVTLVYHSNYTQEFLQYTGLQLVELMRRISEWANGNVDGNPLLELASTIFQYNKPLSRELFPYLDNVLRVALNRLSVSTASLSRLLRVTGNFHRKVQDDTVQGNLVITVFEILGEALKLKVRVLPSTISAMLETLTHREDAGRGPLISTYPQQFSALIDPSIYFLDGHVWADLQSINDFTTSAAVARIILGVALPKFDQFRNGPSSAPPPEIIPHGLGMRAWNMLLVVALMDSSAEWDSMLYHHLPMFSSVHRACLGNVPSPIDVNHGYIAIKLWLMLAQKISEKLAVGTSASLVVWNELWLPFEALVNSFEVEFQAGNRTPSPMMTLTWSSVADLFLFVRSLRCPLALESSMHIAILNRLHTLEPGESSNSKISRTLRSMVEPATETSSWTLTQQAAQDIVAAEKLLVLETTMRPVAGERSKREREARATT